MAIDKAIMFVKRATTEIAFRKTCYNCQSRQELIDKIGFDEIEFEDAVNMQLVKCQTYEEAEVYQQIKMWFLAL